MEYPILGFVKHKIETSSVETIFTYSLFQWYKFDDDVVSQVRGFSSFLLPLYLSFFFFSSVYSVSFLINQIVIQKGNNYDKKLFRITILCQKINLDYFFHNPSSHYRQCLLT